MATALALEWIHNHPGGFAVLLPKKIWRLWAPDGEGEWAYEAGFADYAKYQAIFKASRLVNQAYYFGLMLLMLLSVWLYWRGPPSVRFVTGYALILFTTAISVVFSGQSRFHFPMIPWIAMYASWSILHLIRARQSAPLICSRRVFNGGVWDEADQHGDT